ncbi:Clp protease N-terminal domain-containing protein [Streptomyces albireticuli]|uniref:Clp protease N-terminal domain-containing protein n=1 Tax=Streptomyces albireticuli TaxID=1940 RepID=UPI0036B7F582
MFERFTLNARIAVVRSQQEARELGHPWIGSEHLMLGLLAEKEVPILALARLGVTYDAYRPAVLAAADGGLGLAEEDREALTGAGIDLAAVREHFLRTQAPAAPAPAPEPEPARRWLPFGRRKAAAPAPSPAPASIVVPGLAPDAHLPFTPHGQRALDSASKVMLAQADDRITLAHVVLGLLTPADELLSRSLQRVGTDIEPVRAAVLADLGQVA